MQRLIGALLLALVLTGCSLSDKPNEPSPTPPTIAPTTPPPSGPADPPPPQPGMEKKPNVVEILADDMRWDDLRYAPNLRKLMEREGIFLANMFSNYPLCCPARAAFFSGQLPHNHHVYSVSPPYGYRAFDDRATIATSLRAQGYATGFVGKYLNGYGSDTALAPNLQAEEAGSEAPNVESQYYVPDGWDEWRGAIQGKYCDPACGGAYHYFHYAWSENGSPVSGKRGLYSSDVMGRQGTNLIKQFSQSRRDNRNPFFLSVNFIGPHNGGSDGQDAYKAAAQGIPCNVEGPAAPAWAYETPEVQSIERGAGVMAGGVTENSVTDKPGSWSEYPELNPCQLRAVKHSTVMRAAAVMALDRSVGRMIERLKEEGEWRRTVFLFWSDNGYFQGEHRREAGKRLAYEPAFRVPAVITGPGLRGEGKDGIFGGQDFYRPVDVTDLTATILDFAGAEPPHTPDGTSLLSQDEAWTRAVEYEAANVILKTEEDRDEDFARRRDGLKDPRSAIGVRTSRYLYVRYLAGEYELYDLWKDPLQWDNLASDNGWLAKNGQVLTDLEQVWAGVKDCSGPACHADLPPSLSVSAEENKRQSLEWYEAMAQAYS